MNERLHVVSVNQDRGISPSREKGAAIHLNAMRKAFRQLGVHLTAVDDGDETKVRTLMARIHGDNPVGLIYERYALTGLMPSGSRLHQLN